MKKRENLTLREVVFFNPTLRGVWLWHLRSEIRKITGKIGFKLSFFMGKGPSCLQIFLNTSKISKFLQVLNSGKVY